MHDKKRKGCRYTAWLMLWLTCVVMSVTAHASEVLRIKGWAGYFPAAEVKSFESYIQQKYQRNLKLEIDETMSAPEQSYDAIRTQEFDVVSFTHNLDKDPRFDFYHKGLVIPLNLKQIPNQEHLLPVFKNTTYFKREEIAYSLPFILGQYGLFYNTQKMSAPTSWGALWANENKKQYSISSDYYEINIYITALASGISSKGDDYYTYDKLVKDPKFINNLNALVRNSNTMWQSAETAQLLTNLKLAAGWGTAVGDLKNDGQRWAQAYPNEGTTAWFDGYVIGYSLNDTGMKFGKNKVERDRPFLRQVANEWINFSLSPAYQVALVKGWHSLPTIDNAGSLLNAQEIQDYQINDTEKKLNNMLLWPTLNARDRNGLKQLWEAAVAANNTR